MKSFKKLEEKKIRKLVKEGKTQRKIAIALHTRKENIAAFLIKRKIGKRSPFAKDVAGYRSITGESYKSAVHTIKMTEKWLGKRVEKLSEEEQAMQKAWARHTREYRRQHFKEGTVDLSERLMEDYEEYFETEK